MSDIPVTEILSGGGVLVFAFSVWRMQLETRQSQERKADEVKASIDRMAEDLGEELKAIQETQVRIVERLARIDDRTYRAETEAPTPVPRPYRTRSKTPAPIAPRPRNQTPFTGGDKDR